MPISNEYAYKINSDISSYNKQRFYLCNYLAVTQDYRTDAQIVYVIFGNSALLKCEIPSFVADFVTLESWVDSLGNEYFSGLNSNYGNDMCSQLECNVKLIIDKQVHHMSTSKDNLSLYKLFL